MHSPASPSSIGGNISANNLHTLQFLRYNTYMLAIVQHKLSNTMQTYTLTDEQSLAINTAAHTHNYAAAAEAAYEASGEDVCNTYTQLFEQQTNICATAVAEDIGGLIVYYNTDSTLAAFYDYENFVGTVF